MKMRHQQPKVTDTLGRDKKPRFGIEKLEERIAPRCPPGCGKSGGEHGGGGGGGCHYNAQGKLVGNC